MSEWNSAHYLEYQAERTRPAFDLASAIAVERPRTIVDLGCGPGNSTQILRRRWPEAEITGIDNSHAMLDAARAESPRLRWQFADIASWSSDQPVDLLFSNAALQWLRDQDQLLPRLMSHVSRGGAFAFQIPSATYATVRTLIHEIAADDRWASRMTPPLSRLTMGAPSHYYDLLSTESERLDIWETEYFHVMESREAILNWIASTGLRPFLDVLEDPEKDHFTEELRSRTAEAYPSQRDGKVLFPFRRTFVVAYR